ncbi:L,D-transpeptidase [Nocardioides jensenii]|uniref:L,D-transpeptidase n=1 Tax=Nocardioides jensenii TaxID=1843 RepID=UPI0012F9C940|nr:L,D-transpeptidase [Nocardioides jensenii]
MSRHRMEPIRPRYGRIVAVVASVMVTMTAVLGGLGVLPTGGSGAAALTTSVGSAMSSQSSPSQDQSAVTDQLSSNRSTARVPMKSVSRAPVLDVDPDVAPADSGEGRRVVFSQNDQRVWLISDDDEVERSYLVSGSVYDNLQPGSYAVFSRSEQAWGIDDSGTMRWFVRFAHGPNAAIGFHDIPVDDGAPVQTLEQLGTPLSHGCIRQRTDDARALWDFAPIGTEVVVV